MAPSGPAVTSPGYQILYLLLQGGFYEGKAESNAVTLKSTSSSKSEKLGFTTCPTMHQLCDPGQCSFLSLGASLEIGAKDSHHRSFTGVFIQHLNMNTNC